MSEQRARRHSRRAVSAAFLLVMLVSAAPAMAHKLKVFATAAGDRIQGSAYFAGGSPAAGAAILIQDGEGRVLAHLAPGKDGSFSYQVQIPAEHIVVARTDDGHEARWRIGADELAPAFGSTRGAGRAALPSASSSPGGASRAEASEPAVGTAAAPSSIAESELDPKTIAAIEQAVARQVRPLREELSAAQDQIRLRDILGGIGYILGLTGLGLWLRSRGPGGRP